jgi:transposase
MIRTFDTAGVTQSEEAPAAPVSPTDVIARLEAEIAARDEIIKSLLARVAELERRLGLDSSNSGKPPSSDGLKKPPRTTSLREPSGRKPGGQKGHPGTTLRRTEHPDAIVDHLPRVCAHCGEAMAMTDSVGHQARQVFDLPDPQPLRVTEHRAHECRCGKCGASARGQFPDAVTGPVQYGPNVAATVAYLSAEQYIPEDRIARLLHDLHRIDISAASIAAMLHRKAFELAGFADAVGQAVRAVAVKHGDETGLRIGGALRWLQVAATALLTFYLVTIKRGEIITGMAGVLVHDHFGPYFGLEGVLHALCNAHHLRELKALVEIEKEQWARDMARLLRLACHAANQARGSPVRPSFVAVFTARYRRIVAEGLAFHQAQPPLDPPSKKKRGRPKRRPGHNLVIRLRDHEDAVLRFLHDPAVPFTNNVAEQGGRMMKVKMKISGCFRTIEGAHVFTILRGTADTARKQGWNVLDALKTPSPILIARLKAA